MSLTKFDTLLIPLYRQTTLAGGGRTGVLELATPELVRLLDTVRANERRYGVVILRDVDIDLAPGVSIEVELGDPATGLGLLADTFDDVLQFPRGRSAVPRFFWLEHGLAYTDGGLDLIPTFVRYKAVLELVSLLAKGAAYFDTDKEELVFINIGKVSVPVRYAKADLDELNEAALNTLLGQLRGDDKLHEQLLPILAEAAIKHVCGLEPSKRFASLLGHLPEVLKDFDDGRRLYVASFSYEKVRSQLEADMLDEMARINKTLADVQGQILGIPVATALVATQFKVVTVWGPDAWVNTIVLAGVLAFVLLANFVMLNQLHTLEAIDSEIKRKEAKVLSEYAVVKDMVSKPFTKLAARLKTQKAAFYCVQGILGTGFLFTLALYFVMTEPAKLFLFG